MVARHVSRAIGLCFAALALLAPQLALACPYCAGRAQGGIGTSIVLVTFVSLPFFLAWAIYRIVKADEAGRLGRELLPSETSAFTRSRRKAQ